MGEPEKTLIEFLDEFPELSRRQRLGFGENVCARPEGYCERLELVECLLAMM
jgi:hypothetical protein